ncbi:MAG TPA: methylmalonyl-CoA mutase [Candidatus Syntrophoarchaeum butanivorans]|uniref:Methylmalonyl-CoA mutase n=1 Tax=Candidatus Syntropharchaeum butanivorans TaxID=1839936 RepID=A0A1F2P6P7_9EURY|nr:MAG: methylmalonyl-CoA mutase subunit alpha [Candidatus Syntrophoarchaeum butanivorans]RJS71209.1 MAG: methylmalonyl-CoA mutase [Candidatus Syntrophoarchaeum sp. WYZ-LMO15]HDM36043.1 methylmalonyl-CoA mutase [Candidatus Syntrophoarchaeum butanivorans]HEC56401.1 methylmalonyl-CoA mutase [Candidatus Syntrophoarchaeum butanivorans]
MFKEDEIKRIEEREKEWLKRIEGVKERKARFETYSGIPIKQLYTPADIRDHNYLEDVGFPGDAPFVRGVYPTMYRSRFWTIRLFSGYGTPEDTNKRWKLLYEEGETGFSAAVDVLTFNGIDPEDPRADVEVGTEGVPLYCIDSMYALTEGLPIDKISVALVVEPFSSAPVCAMYFNMAKGRGIDIRKLMGTCQNDILTMTCGFVPFESVPPDQMLRLACDLIEWCVPEKNVPKWHPINFTTYNYREGGIDAIQELGFGFANAITHIDELIERGWKVDDFVNRLAFHLSAHKDFFEEIAKYRAARRIWYKLMKDKYEAKDPRSYEFRFHIQTAGSSLTAQQPMVNIIRTAFQALAAVLGGCQSMHTNSYDEAICLPSEEAVRLALRTQQVIQEETGVADTIDPLGGSYYVEWLTDEIEERVWKYLDKMTEAGGNVVKLLENGWLYKEMADAFHKRQRAVDEGEERVIGVNCYLSREEEPPIVFRTNEKAGEIERERLRRLKERRDNRKVEELLDKLRRACDKGENVMPAVMDATAAGATLGEVCNVYREVLGTWNPPIVI